MTWGTNGDDMIALEAGHVVRDQEKGGYGFYGAI